jgi:hypothetical protein
VVELRADRKLLPNLTLPPDVPVAVWVTHAKQDDKEPVVNLTGSPRADSFSIIASFAASQVKIPSGANADYYELVRAPGLLDDKEKGTGFSVEGFVNGLNPALECKSRPQTVPAPGAALATYRSFVRDVALAAR